MSIANLLTNNTKSFYNINVHNIQANNITADNDIKSNNNLEVANEIKCEDMKANTIDNNGTSPLSVLAYLKMNRANYTLDFNIGFIEITTPSGYITVTNVPALASNVAFTVNLTGTIINFDSLILLSVGPINALPNAQEGTLRPTCSFLVEDSLFIIVHNLGTAVFNLGVYKFSYLLI